MDILIKPNSLGGEINLIPSKSLSHRYLIAASLSDGISKIDNILNSDDIDATTSALQSFGATINKSEIKGPLYKAPDEVDALESGSTLRFLIPIGLLFSNEIIFKGSNMLPKRPLSPYFDLSKQHGFLIEKIKKDNLPLKIKGPLKGGDYYIDGNISSQFITGLLFALPLLKENSKIIFKTPLESKGYVDLTVDVLKKFKIKIKKKRYGFDIPKNQKYQKGNFVVEGDYSQAAFFIVAGLIGENVIEIKNINKKSLQGDKKIIKIVRKMKGKVKFNNNNLLVYPSKTKSTVIDLKDIPDLGPILMVLASLSSGTTKFINTKRLEIKESNRLKAMQEELAKLGVDVKTKNNEAFVTGINYFKGNTSLSSHLDHRIAMSLAIASIRANSNVTIKNYDVVKKSYPSFFEDFKHLGGIILND